MSQLLPLPLPRLRGSSGEAGEGVALGKAATSPLIYRVQGLTNRVDQAVDMAFFND